MTDVFSTPDDFGEIRQSELHASLGERLGAQAADTLDPKNSLTGMRMVRFARESLAGGEVSFADLDPGLPPDLALRYKDMARAAVPDTPIDDAKARIKQEGLEGHVKLADQPSVKSPVLDLMIAEGHTRRDREMAIARGPHGFMPDALGFVTSLGAGMVDPVNMAAFSIPVLGEARMGKLMASAGDSILARSGARMLQGGAQGAVGTAALQPADWWLHTRDGEDYTLADALKSVVMGAGMGAGFHAAIGGYRDARARMRGAPLEGSPEDLLLRGLMTGRHVPADVLHEDGVGAAHLNEAFGAAEADQPLQEVTPGHVRLYRGEHPDRNQPNGGYFTTDQEMASSFGKLRYIDLPEADAAFFKMPGMPNIYHFPDYEAGPSRTNWRTRATPLHPAQVMADLPPAAREDLVRVAIADIAADRPVRSAEVLQIAAEHSPRIAESFEAWHGSPHEIDRFSMEHIGTGEGAQAYGHGLYFAENEKVARQYQLSTTSRDFVRKAQELYDEFDRPDDAHAAITESKDFTPGQKRLLLALEKDDWLGFDYPHQAVSAALSDPNGKNWEMSPETIDAIKHVGNVYKVRIGANLDHFLDWDKPLSEQSERVRSKLRAAGFKDEQTGKEIYHSLVKYRPGEGGGMTSAGMKVSDLDATPESASGRLGATGIHGIKYLDQGSRGIDTDPARLRQNLENWRANLATRERELKADPRNEELKGFVEDARRAVALAETEVREGAKQTRNVVVFDDKHIEITHKNGEVVGLDQFSPPAAPPAAAAPIAGDRGPAIPDLVTAPKPRGRAAAHPDTLSLNEHLASQGGLKPDPELSAIYGGDRGPFIPGFGPLIRKGGMSLDEALGSAKQHGYLFDPHDAENGTAGAGGRTSHGLTPNDLLDHLDAENRGKKLYKPGHEAATKFDPEQEKHVILGALEAELEKAGANVAAIDPKLLNRTVEIVHREGTSDVMDAYERAIMEDAERYDAIANARQSDARTADIPGFERSDDGRTAPGDGGGDRVNDRQAGRPDQGRGRADDPQSQSHGGRAAAAANDPRWRELADVKPAEFDPEVVSESRAADRLAEPDSLVPEKSLNQLEKQAADAEAIWRKLEPTLTEKERELVNSVLDQLKLDKEARDNIITDGVACLVGAFG